jgi:hypothetical protein
MDIVLLGTLVPALISLGSFLAMAFGAYHWIMRRVREGDDDVQRTADAAMEKAAYAEATLAAYKTEVAKEMSRFATHEHVTQAVSEVRNSVDKAVNRMDAMSNDIHRALLKFASGQ